MTSSNPNDDDHHPQHHETMENSNSTTTTETTMPLRRTEPGEGRLTEATLPPEKLGRSHSTSTTSTTASGRLAGFTEAVPLALSSMAHASLSLQDGVLDGLRQVVSHTLLSCVNYARIVHPPHNWTFRDLTASPFAWEAVKLSTPPKDLSYSLQKLNFKHQYARNALIYLRPALPKDFTHEQELELLKDWSHHVGVLGRITLLYVSKEPLTQGEMDGSDTEDIPATILHQAVVEYRSLPATGSQQAIQAEELSMLSFGGSVDDDVKYGALASLYDKSAKYALEIFSVRGKKYKFDLMDSTLSNGTVPTLPNSREGDPFVKSLCATVTDHVLPENSGQNRKYSLTRINLTLEGKLRQSFDELPSFHYMAAALQGSFLLLNAEPPAMVTASSCGHTLLLDPELAGRVYVNGRYVTNWGKDPRIGSSGVALFGMDLHSIPYWHGHIVDYEVMKVAYARLWQEIVVNARLLEHNITARLLYRLMTGHDPDQDEDDLYDDEDSPADIHTDCLETQVLSSSQYDGVGIAAKALATRFQLEFSAAAFPCLQHEVEWVRMALPDRIPTVVPYRFIKILRRGGYFDTQRTSDDLWFVNGRKAKEGDEVKVVNAAVEFLKQAGFDDLRTDQILFVRPNGVEDPIAKKCVCRYNRTQMQYYVHEAFMTMKLGDSLGSDDDQSERPNPINERGYLLGMEIAKESPDGTMLSRYLLRTRQSAL